MKDLFEEFIQLSHGCVYAAVGYSMGLVFAVPVCACARLPVT